MKRAWLGFVAMMLGFAPQVSAVSTGNITSYGNLAIKNGGTIIFSDGTMQSTATLKGDRGDKGDPGQPGPAGQVTLDAICSAIAAANATLPSFCPVTCPANGNIVGVWVKAGSSPLAGFEVITFIDSSHYFQINTTYVTNGGSPGLEKGTYSYTPATGEFAAATAFDTNGASGFNNGSGGPFTISVCDNTMTIHAAKGLASFNRLMPATSPIVAAWGGNFTDSATGKLGGVMEVFLDNANFVFGQAGHPDGDPTGQSGVEQGTYSWNQANGQFTTKVTLDTNGEWGMSNPRGSMTVTISGTTLTLTDSVDGPFQMQKLGQ